MADTKITDLSVLSSVAAGDIFPVVDISDATDDPAGTTKKITKGILFSATDIAITNLHNAIINVLDYGAKGDGLTDDTTSINTALALGGTVIIPKTSSFYVISSPLLPASNTHLIIEGTIKLSAHANCHCISLLTSNNLIIEGLGIIDGNATNQDATPTLATGGIVSGDPQYLTFDGGNGITIKDITIQNQKYWPINLGRSYHILLENIKATNCPNSWAISRCHDFEVKGCQIDHITGDMSLVAYGGCYNGSFHHNNIHDGLSSGIVVYDDVYSTGACHDIDIHDNITYNNSDVGIAVWSNDSVQHYNIKIHDNFSINDGNNIGNGFGCLTYSKDIEICNNTIINPTGYIGIKAYGKRIMVHGNTIKNVGIGNYGGSIGLMATVAEGGGPYWLTGNFSLDDQVTATTKYNVWFNGEGGSTYTGVVINDNFFTTNLVAGGSAIYNVGGWSVDANRNTSVA